MDSQTIKTHQYEHIHIFNSINFYPLMYDSNSFQYILIHKYNAYVMQYLNKFYYYYDLCSSRCNLITDFLVYNLQCMESNR